MERLSGGDVALEAPTDGRRRELCPVAYAAAARIVRSPLARSAWPATMPLGGMDPRCTNWSAPSYLRAA